MRAWPIAILVALVSASPAMALYCDDNGGGFDTKFSLGFHVGDPYTEADQAELDQMELRRHGVDATRVERWNGCLRAWVRQPGGGEIMQFYDPNSYRQVGP